ncbi:integrase domain-containing protein [Thalassotalea sp. PS06]|uniref:integrase domain-containing protein n=1 Tax=Thalassotalea sp. PS06 TaxID=2594005 RepID=UPI0011648BE2|nr:integrase domain-containing protein [Thalassotalea sp. PS06]QDP01569.1 tyrosine-type recombinase/integrase [Thalassotalea sp. PS06]
MSKKLLPLDTTQIRRAKPQSKSYKLRDGRGLAIKIMPTGSKQWIFEYTKPATGKRSTMGLGVFPDISLKQARDMRQEARKLLGEGIDPVEQKAEDKRLALLANSQTLKNVAAEWFELKKTRVADTTSAGIWRNFNNHLFPKLGHRPITKLAAPEVISVLKPLAARGTLETLSKVIGHLNEVMIYGVNTGYIDHNCLSGIGAAFQPPKSKNLPALKPEELPEFMKALSYASIKIVTRLLIEWQLHTMVRPSEAAGTRWDEIDFDKKQWHIPAERMKTSRDHVVPLSPQALEILSMIKSISGHREHVFPSDRKPTEPCNAQTANMAIKRMGFKGRLVAHGLRSIASTTLNECGHDPEVIEAALAHVDGNEVRRAYNRADYLERRRVLMNWWSNYIEEAATGKKLNDKNIRPIMQQISMKRE